MAKHYERVMEIYREASDLYGALALMGWDQETYMPPKGAASRGRQLATISGLVHERLTSDEMRTEIGHARSESLTLDEDVNIREIARHSDRAVKIPVTLVKELAETSSAAIGVWIKARKENDFPAFAPWVGKLVTLQRETAEAVGYEDEPYDALLDEYEPAVTTKETAAVFDSIRGPSWTWYSVSTNRGLRRVSISWRETTPSKISGAWASWPPSAWASTSRPADWTFLPILSVRTWASTTSE